MMEGSGSGSIALTNRSGCGRTRNLWIQIRNTANDTMGWISKSSFLCAYPEDLHRLCCRIQSLPPRAQRLQRGSVMTLPDLGPGGLPPSLHRFFSLQPGAAFPPPEQLSLLKGSLTQDFWLQAFFTNRFPPGLWASYQGLFKFLWKFAEIFKSKG